MGEFWGEISRFWCCPQRRKSPSVGPESPPSLSPTGAAGWGSVSADFGVKMDGFGVLWGGVGVFGVVFNEF